MSNAAPITRDRSGDPLHTEGPWEYVPSNQNHGPYVTDRWGSDVCDCYTMSNPSALAVCNGGDSKPVHFQPGQADANARLISAAPEMLAALKKIVEENREFRASMPEDWEGDPLQEACEVADMLIAKVEGR